MLQQLVCGVMPDHGTFPGAVRCSTLACLPLAMALVTATVVGRPVAMPFAAAVPALPHPPANPPCAAQEHDRGNDDLLHGALVLFLWPDAVQAVRPHPAELIVVQREELGPGSEERRSWTLLWPSSVSVDLSGVSLQSLPGRSTAADAAKQHAAVALSAAEQLL